VEVTISTGDRKINNDANSGKKKKCDAAKKYCKGQKESPASPPVRRREVVWTRERRVVV
jgi:hypothetical protein